MKISPEKLAAVAEATGFRHDVLEKVAHLLGLLNSLGNHPVLKGKLVLKGGTALNLFVFDVPRLSVDIDLNYIGAEDRDGGGGLGHRQPFVASARTKNAAFAGRSAIRRMR